MRHRPTPWSIDAKACAIIVARSLVMIRKWGADSDDAGKTINALFSAKDHDRVINESSRCTSPIACLSHVIATEEIASDEAKDGLFKLIAAKVDKSARD
jgi:hypothetical protein